MSAKSNVHAVLAMKNGNFSPLLKSIYIKNIMIERDVKLKKSGMCSLMLHFQYKLLAVYVPENSLLPLKVERLS